jgi:AcrR family transcriptional regulator
VPTTPARETRRKRRARGSISAEEILVGAYEFAMEESLEALSMPRLAQRLDVGVTSIYWYFRSKEDLLDTMTERAMQEFDRGFDIPDGLSWDEYLRTYFRQFRQTFRANGLLVDLIVMRNATLTPEATRIAATRIDGVLNVLVESGFSPDQALCAYGALSLFARGSVAAERTWIIAGRPPQTTSSAFGEVPGVTVLSRLQHPHVLAMTSDEHFEFGLENAIRGLMALSREAPVG